MQHMQRTVYTAYAAYTPYPAYSRYSIYSICGIYSICSIYSISSINSTCSCKYRGKSTKSKLFLNFGFMHAKISRKTCKYRRKALNIKANIGKTHIFHLFTRFQSPQARNPAGPPNFSKMSGPQIRSIHLTKTAHLDPFGAPGAQGGFGSSLGPLNSEPRTGRSFSLF